MPLILLLACQVSFGGKDDTATTAGDSNNTGTGGETLQDVRDIMARNADNCQDLSGDVIAGANSYFWGEYLGNNEEGWSGQEKAYIFMNEESKSKGLVDCEETWEVLANPAEPGACAACDIGMEVTLTFTTSTCVDPVFGGDNGTTTYDVDQGSDGSSHWFYANTGTALGDGYWSAKGQNFLTSPSCRWF
jgi:hypothetical protein